jgi:hypothetical protein
MDVGIFPVFEFGVTLFARLANSLAMENYNTPNPGLNASVERIQTAPPTVWKSRENAAWARGCAQDEIYELFYDIDTTER